MWWQTLKGRNSLRSRRKRTENCWWMWWSTFLKWRKWRVLLRRLSKGWREWSSNSRSTQSPFLPIRTPRSPFKVFKQPSLPLTKPIRKWMRWKKIFWIWLASKPSRSRRSLTNSPRRSTDLRQISNPTFHTFTIRQVRLSRLEASTRSSMSTTISCKDSRREPNRMLSLKTCSNWNPDNTNPWRSV